MPLRVLVDHIEKKVFLSPDDQYALAGIPFLERSLKDGERLACRDEIARQCTILLKGFLLRRKLVSTRNQIIAMHVPGDLPDLQTLHLPVLDHDIVSAGPSTVAVVSHDALNRVLDNSPRLTHLLWRETLVDAAIFREWVCNVGFRDAPTRIAHLLCELASRFEAVGLLDDNQFQVPLTQHHVADAACLSVVHVNRTLQELKRTGLISWEGRSVRLLRRDRLEEVGDFSSDYLHQKDDR